MPNWCSNRVTFSHDNESELNRLIKAYNQDRLFSEFFPMPAELRDVSAPNDTNADEMIDKYGAADWYSWAVDNWGTKWEVQSVDDLEHESGQTEVTVYFDSAWGPPTRFFEKMEEQGWTVTAMYYEPGMAFCGRYEDGWETTYDIVGDSAWVKENIPADVNEAFDIAGSMEIWEEDERNNS